MTEAEERHMAEATIHHEAAKHVAEEVRHEVDRLPHLYHLLIGAVVVLMVVVIALQWQVSQRNRHLDDIADQVVELRQVADQSRSASEQAKAASEATDAYLRSLVSASQTGESDSAQAMAAIHRIEAQVTALQEAVAAG